MQPDTRHKTNKHRVNSNRKRSESCRYILHCYNIQAQVNADVQQTIYRKLFPFFAGRQSFFNSNGINWTYLPSMAGKLFLVAFSCYRFYLLLINPIRIITILTGLRVCYGLLLWYQFLPFNYGCILYGMIL